MKIKVLIVLILSCIFIACNNEKKNNVPVKTEQTVLHENNTSLKSKLDKRKSDFSKKANQDLKTKFKAGIEELANSGILKSAKQVGQKAPDFKLTNALGHEVILSEELKKGRVVLTWYRGNWCPYCNLTIHALQQELPNFKANNTSLIALTPELPDESVSMKKKHDLQFEVLSDVGNKVAKEYGIVFLLNEEVAAIYNKMFGLNEHNGDNTNELPLAATYVIEQDGTISYAFLDADYTKRAEPKEIIDFLSNKK